MEQKQRQNDFLEMVCNLYIVFLLAVLPLYTNGSYYNIGDSKYMLFRNVSLLCLGIWLVVAGAAFVMGTKERRKWSFVDSFVLLYGICVLLSAGASPFQKTAWTGYQDWYMGAFSQLLFVGIYFFVSREYAYTRMPLYLGELAFLAVTVIGLLSRLGLDPIGLFAGIGEKDWEYSHMLSTIGNINWLCGYYSVALSLPMSGYFQSKKKEKAVSLYIISVLGLLLLCIQGSDSGLMLAFLAIVTGFVVGIHKKEILYRTVWLAAGVTFLFPLMGKSIEWREMQAATPTDGDIFAKMLWQGWWLVAALLLLFGIFMKRKMVRKVVCVLLTGSGIILLGCVCVKFVQDISRGNIVWQEWGSGRGMLWNLSWKGFVSFSPLRMLVGAGPDCFAEYLSSVGISTVITETEHWAGAVFANAHNEWLNHMVNLGLLGTGCYLGIFVSAWKRYRGMLLAVLLLILYGAHSMISFQQVLNTPLLFLLLGICENTVRRVTD